MIYRTEHEKFNAAVDEIRELHQMGRRCWSVPFRLKIRAAQHLPETPRHSPMSYGCQESRTKRNYGRPGAKRDDSTNMAGAARISC